MLHSSPSRLHRSHLLLINHLYLITFSHNPHRPNVLILHCGTSLSLKALKGPPPDHLASYPYIDWVTLHTAQTSHLEFVGLFQPARLKLSPPLRLSFLFWFSSFQIARAPTVHIYLKITHSCTVFILDATSFGKCAYKISTKVAFGNGASKNLFIAVYWMKCCAMLLIVPKIIERP